MKPSKSVYQSFAASIVLAANIHPCNARQPKPVLLEVTGHSTIAELTLPGQAGRLYQIETSNDLEKWTNNLYVAGNNSPIEISFPVAGFPRRFFRAWEYEPLTSSATLDYVASGLAFYPERWIANGVDPTMSVFRGKEIAFLANDDWFPGDFDPLVMSTVVNKIATSSTVSWHSAFTGPGSNRIPNGQGGFLPLSDPPVL